MHSHYGLQEQLLMSAPLIIHDASDKADQQEVVIMLADFSFTPPEQILEQLRKGGHLAHMHHWTRQRTNWRPCTMRCRWRKAEDT